MGGTSSQNTQQQQQSQSSPWAPAQPLLSGILGQLQGQLPSAQLNPNEQAAISGLQGNAGFLNQFAPQLQANTSNLLAGGGAKDQAGLINNAYGQYQQQLSPYLQQSYLDPMQTPGFSDALKTLNSDITGQINGQFAAAGRDMSGMNTQTLARGLSQGEGGLLANQYNQNVQNQLAAAQSLYGAGNTTGGLLSGLNQQALANQQAGVGSAGAAQDVNNAQYQNQLAAAALQRGIPLSYLQQIAGIGTPIAGLGGQSTSASAGNQQNQMSGAQRFALITGGLGNLFRGAASAFPGGGA